MNRIIVIGSSHGIGRSTTKRFLDEGFEVYGCAHTRNDPVVKQLTSEQYTRDQKVQDCWGLGQVPHQHFDHITNTVYKKIFKEWQDGRREQSIFEVFHDAVEFQLRWWIYYISRYMKLKPSVTLRRRNSG